MTDYDENYGEPSTTEECEPPLRLNPVTDRMRAAIRL